MNTVPNLKNFWVNQNGSAAEDTANILVIVAFVCAMILAVFYVIQYVFIGTLGGEIVHNLMRMAGGV